jgi:hypothetical protein
VAYQLDDPFRDFNLSQEVVARLWKKQFPIVYYESVSEDSDELWGGDLTGDGLWGGDLGSTAAEQKEVHAFLSDSTFFARRIGFEVIKDAIIVIPEVLVIESGIEPRKGDKIIHGPLTFSIGDLLPFGAWRKSNKYLYVAMNCRSL